MPLPPDYAERVYAGVLGKLIGVYLGRNFEGWTYDRIMAELGEITYYTNERFGQPLVVTDDDISGTFTFLRALPDNGNRRDISAAQIGDSWLNYLIEERAILWWGGLGMSTEHTAFLRLKDGVRAPASGSLALNSKIIAEQIGAQIFIDGWAMVAPGDPELAADLARRAASVSHDREAIYGAQVIAAMESLAFVEPDLERLLDAAVGLIPVDSTIAAVIGDLREWRGQSDDWRVTLRKVQDRYGYDKYLGSCHIVPNHAIVMLALLHGDDDFQRSQMIANTCGWDTDCNSGNVGCLLGVKNGLAGIDAGPDWRSPVADRMYVSSADGGSAITDAAREALTVVNIGRALAGEAPLAFKDGARFHFAFPGSVQGFQPHAAPDARGVASVENVEHGAGRALAIDLRRLAPGRVARVTTPTFIPPEDLAMERYSLLACPTLYPGQVVRASIAAASDNALSVDCRLIVLVYDEHDNLGTVAGPDMALAPGDLRLLAWEIPVTGGQPVAEVGIEITSDAPCDGRVLLDWLDWSGTPEVTFAAPDAGTAWQRAWVNGVDRVDWRDPQHWRVIQNEGTGLLIQGTRDWRDYRVTATLTPEMVAECGIAARVQGMRRYYALLLVPGNRVQLVRMRDERTVLAASSLEWAYWRPVDLALEVVDNRLRASVDGQELFDVHDDDPLVSGAVALVCTEGTIAVRRAPHISRASGIEFEN